MVRVLLIFLALEACSGNQHQDLKTLGDLPKSLSEISALQVCEKGIWALEDGGNKNKIYQINEEAKIVRELKLLKGKNHDWEDLAEDQEGNLYIGDFGNNENDRMNLAVYKIPKQQLESGEITPDKIKFSYPEQKNYPPASDRFIFDAEALIHWKNALYVFTKDRSDPYSGMTSVYKIPDVAGEYEAKKIGEFKLCDYRHYCSVTGADISPDGQTIALVTNGFIFLLTDFSSDSFTNAKTELIDLNVRTQLESIAFLDSSTLLLADEQAHGQGGNLYSFKLDGARK